jgi:hypothetical protein
VQEKYMKKATAVRTRHPKATTRATILAKAYEMYLDRRLIHGDERLSHVLDELGYTTGAGYQIWANQAAFRRDLQIYVAENIAYANPELVAADVEKALAASESADEVSLHVADLYFAAMVGVKEFYLTLRFLGMGEERPEEISETLSDAYERSSWEVVERLENALTQVKRRMRDGLTVEGLGVAITALLEGYALRFAAQPEKASKKYEYDGRSHTGFAVAYLGIVNQFTEPVDA